MNNTKRKRTGRSKRFFKFEWNLQYIVITLLGWAFLSLVRALGRR